MTKLQTGMIITNQNSKLNSYFDLLVTGLSNLLSIVKPSCTEDAHHDVLKCRLKSIDSYKLDI